MISVARKQYQGKSKKRIIIFVILFGILLLAGSIMIGIFTVNTVEVEGNEHYTKDEIKELIIDTKYTHNTLYLFWKYKYTDTKEIPFIDTVEVEILTPGKVKIRVYEKNIVGYIKYLENYMYFDKDGIVVESSTEILQDVPFITGLNFDHIILHERLPVEEPSIFKTILALTQSIKKSDIVPDKIFFDKDTNIILYYEKVRVLLGDNSNLEEKIVRLQYLLPDLTGLSGSLHMENFNKDTENITFERE